MNKATEKILLIRIQNGKDPKAFEKLYDHMADQIYRFIFFKVSDPHIAEDLTADVFLKSWKALTNDVREVKHLKSYIYIIARSAIIDHYRSREHNLNTSLNEAQMLKEPEELSVKIETKIEAEYLIDLMTRLKDSYREVLILKHLQELSLKEIARVISKSPVATRVLLHRAQQALKREYEKTTTKTSV